MNTAPAPFTTPKAEQTCFVYDLATGCVLHIHQFFPLEAGGRCAEAEMERAALELVSRDLSQSNLAVLHHSGELRLKPGHRYSIDRERQTFIAEPQDSPARDDRRSSD
jgi:hypothetical protein